MKYVKYGKTDKEVSVVGFGGMRFDNARPDAENAALLHHARDRGINYFDTAPGYCGDRSEAIFGIAFKDLPKPYFVSTKGMPTQCDTAEKARDAVKRSLDRLGVDKINFYHVWCLRKMAHYELAMKPGGQYEGLLQCREEGLIDHIVCSSHQPGAEVATLLSRDEFEGVLLGINVLNFPYRWDGVIAAQARGCAVVAMNPLGGGAIPRHEAAFAFLAEHGETPTEAALRFNIACPQITITLVGFANREQIDMACRVADQAQPMTEAALDGIRDGIGSHLNEICTGCGYCKDCPQGIPVPGYMQYYNEKLLFGKSDKAMKKGIAEQHEWLLLVGRQADAKDCTACGRCEEACTQHLPIVARLKELAAWEKVTLGDRLKRTRRRIKKELKRFLRRKK